jgi:solute carrier family 32 (vesicular inhibitory amino acid transporter)
MPVLSLLFLSARLPSDRTVCHAVVLILLVDGFVKPTSPGSLIDPAKTYLFPANWITLPLSFGLLMSPWYVLAERQPFSSKLTRYSGVAIVYFQT